MTPQLQTDTPTLSAEAGSFMSISGELKGVMGSVEQTAVGLSGSWEGVAAGAAQDALVRYQEAAMVQKNLLDDIAENIQAGGVKYENADSDGASSLASVDLGINH